MKIVSEGKWNNPWTLEVTCPCADCGAELMVEEKDVKASGYRYESGAKYSAACPVCGQFISLMSSAISPRVKRDADARRSERPYSSWD